MELARVALVARRPPCPLPGVPRLRQRNRPGDWVAWITAARDAGLDAVAVTDHNTAAGIAPLQDAASRVQNSPVLIPGVEVTASDGAHLIVLFDPTCSDQHVEDFLSRVKIPVDKRGDETARSSFSVEQILDECPDGALIVGPHVNQPRGLLDLSGQERCAVLRHPSLAAVEVVPDYPVDESWIDGSKSEIGRSLPRLWGSDLSGDGRRPGCVSGTVSADHAGSRTQLMTDADLLRHIRLGEDGRVEFKQVSFRGTGSRIRRGTTLPMNSRLSRTVAGTLSSSAFMTRRMRSVESCRGTYRNTS